MLLSASSERCGGAFRFGFPAAVLINTKKERFASSRLAFDEAGLTSFVEGLLTGKQGTEPYPADGLPAITEVTASQPTLMSAELSELTSCHASESLV